MPMSRVPTVPCRRCGSLRHFPFACPTRRKPLKTTKPMNKIGRVGKATKAAVASWKKTQKPTHEGYFICYICGKWVAYLTAEHTKSKARHPEFRTDKSKLKPTCDECNKSKGSKDSND